VSRLRIAMRKKGERIDAWGIVGSTSAAIAPRSAEGRG
jgi:hypothetical protein